MSKTWRVMALAPALALALALAVAAGLAGTTAANAAGDRIIERFPQPAALAGFTPVGALLKGPDGSLYGATSQGGAQQGGAIYRLSPPAHPSGSWRLSALYAFAGGTDGSNPTGDLIMDSAGNLYGVTASGGNLACYPDAGCGTVFRLSPPAVAGQPWTKQTLLAFSRSPADGAFPLGGLLIGNNGELYGTTRQGGAAAGADSGTVFRLTPPAAPGGAWTEAVLWSFGIAPGDGVSPYAGLTAGSGGTLYGTTVNGGAALGGQGTVFALTPPAAPGGAWTEQILYSFGRAPDGADPYAGRLLLSGGSLYGTTLYGGADTGSGYGTVYRLTPKAGGIWRKQTLYAFPEPRQPSGLSPLGAFPLGGVVADASGALYGLTNQGGAYCAAGSCNGVGVAFKLAPNGRGVWTETLLHTFKFGTADGWYPAGTPIWQAQGVLAGITQDGGSGTACPLSAGCGAVFLQTVP